MKIIIGADHAGVKLKKEIIKYLEKQKIDYEDVGSFDSKSKDDYPDFAIHVAKKVVKDKDSKGILICGSGTGMVIAANKVKGVRAALAYDSFSAKKSREDNDANILCLRGRKFSEKDSMKVVATWLKTPFSKISRHKRRIKKIGDFEKKGR